ncbi:MAG TPA: flagellar hook capping FlgD N-terminal domain-containing protein [Candidatus Methylacidiphilales bacterium]
MSVSTVPAAGSAGGTNSTNSPTYTNGQLSASDFYKIIVAQLENQSPDDTADSNAMVQNMMSIANYQAISGMSTDTTKLTNYSTANTLLGKTATVQPSTDSNDTVSGTVTNVVYNSDGTASVMINGNAYDLSTVVSAANPTSNGAGTATGN